MGKGKVFAAVGIAAMVVTTGRSVMADDSAERGRQVFRGCAVCHSIQQGVNRIGPSLANIWGRKAATVEGFSWYSKALRDSDVVWNAETLDAWLKKPTAFMPGNRMIFPGIPDRATRADLIAFLKRVSDHAPNPAGEAASST